MTRLAWCDRVQRCLNIGFDEGKAMLVTGTLPFGRIERWVIEEFGFDESFRDAVVRNIHGWADWVYGNGEEPYWPGSDQDR